MSKKSKPAPAQFTKEQIEAARKVGGVRAIGKAPTTNLGSKSSSKPAAQKAPTATATIKVTATAGGEKKALVRVKKDATTAPTTKHSAVSEIAKKVGKLARGIQDTIQEKKDSKAKVPPAKKDDAKGINPFWLVIFMMGIIIVFLVLMSVYGDKTATAPLIIRDIGITNQLPTTVTPGATTNVQPPVVAPVTKTNDTAITAPVVSPATNTPVKPEIKVKLEWPSINGIEGDNNDHNSVITIGQVVVGSFNGTTTPADTAAVKAAKDAAAAVNSVPGGLPNGCTKVLRIEVPRSELDTRKVIQLPTIEMVPGQYVQAIIPPNGWSLTFNCSTQGKLNITEDGKPYTRGTYDPNKQNVQVSEFGFYLEPGTTSARLEITYSHK